MRTRSDHEQLGAVEYQLAPTERPMSPGSAVGPAVPTAMRWGSVSLALLAMTTVAPTARTIGAGALACSYAAVRGAFPIRSSAPPVRLATVCAAETAIGLVALAIAGGWGSPLVLVVGAAALTSGLVGGLRCVAASSFVVAAAAFGSSVATGHASHGVVATIAVALVGSVGAYGRHLEGVALRRVETASGTRSAIEERERLARELHDRVGQSLAAVVMALDQLAESWPVPSASDAVGDELRRLADDVRVAHRQVRAQLQELSIPRAGAEIGAALAAHVGKVAARGRIRPLLELDDDCSLSDLVAEDLFQMAKEALANAERHSGASFVEVRLSVVRGGARLEIADDGGGVDTRTPEGMGLTSMRQRAATIDATFTIGRSRMGGTLVVIEVGWGR